MRTSKTYPSMSSAKQTHVFLTSISFVIMTFFLVGTGCQSSKPLTGKYTIEQAGTDNCVTFDAANNALEDDRLFTSRCREGLREGTQNFTVITDRNNGHFSLATEDQKCFYADTNKDIRRDKSFCSKTLSYFVAQRAGSSSILVKEWPSNSCLNANLDGTLNFEACDSGSQRQTWKVCRSDDPSICLRNYPL